MVKSNPHPEIQFTEPTFDGLYRSSQELGERRVLILQAAYAVLSTEGYQGFTMRRIANQAQMHLKTLQHYYATKKDLLMETLRHIILEKYREFWEVLSRKRAENPREILRLVVTYFLNDIKDPITSRFFPELWALATHDSDAAFVMDHLYSLYRKNMNELIRAINPTLSEQKSAQRTVAVVAMVEGLILFMGHGKKRSSELQDVEGEIINAAMQIVLMP